MANEIIPVEDIRLPDSVRQVLPIGLRAYRFGTCTLMVSKERIDLHDTLLLPRRWHLSISHPSRYPTWDEIGEARDRFIPNDVMMCVPFPAREYWLSIHPNCFHLWELHDDQLVEQWKFDGAGACEIGRGKPQAENDG